MPSRKIKNKKIKRDGVLGFRLGRRFCFAEVSTGDPHPSPTKFDMFSADKMQLKKERISPFLFKLFLLILFRFCGCTLLIKHPKGT